jgi:hypothetical protein
MKLLELFSGTGSIGDAFRARGWEVISLDSDPAARATICADIMDWDPTSIGPVDFVWASPPCTQYSKARTRAKLPRDLALADAIVRRTLEIILELSPWAWIMENPDTGLLKTRGFMRTVPVLGVIDYCQYGYLYRKRTRLWGCCPDVGFLPLCKKDSCHAVVDGKHRLSAQRGTSRGSSTDRAMTVSELYRIPRALCRDISYAATRLILWGPGHAVL